MKKGIKLGIVLLLIITLSGCFKSKSENVLDDFIKKIEKLDGYYLDGELEIINNEDSYLYSVEVAYYKENNFRVSLKNKVNNHEQIILRNTEGVYVLTPSLNKSFKFQSDWPYNNSQSYLLQPISNDLKNDEERTVEEVDGGYLFTTKANYTSNNDISKQTILIDKDLNVKEVVVYDNNNQMKIKMKFNSIDYKATFDNTYFSLNANVFNSETMETNKTLDSIIYPMYIPENTQLSGQEKITTENGERIILTFSGDSPFMIVQESVNTSEQILTIPMYGEPYIVTGTVGALSDSSVTWVNNGVEFYVVSEVLDKEQLLNIANSISVASMK